MPIYEYCYEVCNSNFEVFKKLAKNLLKSIKCNKSSKVVKLLSAQDLVERQQLLKQILRVKVKKPSLDNGVNKKKDLKK